MRISLAFGDDAELSEWLAGSSCDIGFKPPILMSARQWISGIRKMSKDSLLACCRRLEYISLEAPVCQTVTRWRSEWDRVSTPCFPHPNLNDPSAHFPRQSLCLHTLWELLQMLHFISTNWIRQMQRGLLACNSFLKNLEGIFLCSWVSRNPDWV